MEENKILEEQLQNAIKVLEENKKKRMEEFSIELQELCKKFNVEISSQIMVNAL